MSYIANATTFSNEKSRFSKSNNLNSLISKKYANHQNLNKNILKNNNLILSTNNPNVQKIKSFLNMLGLRVLIEKQNLFDDFKELINPPYSTTSNDIDLKLIVTSINSYQKNIQVPFEDKIKLRLAVLNILKNKDTIMQNVMSKLYAF